MEEVHTKKQIGVIVLLLGLFILTGCIDWHGPEEIHLDLLLVSEENVENPILNITNVNFTRYPTLKQAIDSLITSSENATSIIIEISSEERNRIVFELLKPSEDLYYTYISYYQYYFNIGFLVN